jgi:hypothetical protein
MSRNVHTLPVFFARECYSLREHIMDFHLICTPVAPPAPPILRVALLSVLNGEAVST